VDRLLPKTVERRRLRGDPGSGAGEPCHRWRLQSDRLAWIAVGVSLVYSNRVCYDTVQCLLDGSGVRQAGGFSGRSGLGEVSSRLLGVSP
jgi:hypothetical protein